MRNSSELLSTLNITPQREKYFSSESDNNWLIPNFNHYLNHELSPDLEDSFIQESVTVLPSPFPTKVNISSTVRAVGARGLRSPPYLASIRRRECGQIARLIASLPQQAANNDDFIAWTHEPFDKIRSLLDKLSAAEECREIEYEGNSCEILRQLRDTFLGNGWKRYCKNNVCDKALYVLRQLATEEEITRDHVYDSLEKLLDAGLDPAIGITIDDVEEEEILD